MITSEQETKQNPDGTVAVDGPNLNVPDGKLTRLAVTRPGEPARPRRRRKGHECHRRDAECQCNNNRPRLRSRPREAADAC